MDISDEEIEAKPTPKRRSTDISLPGRSKKPRVAELPGGTAPLTLEDPRSPATSSRQPRQRPPARRATTAAALLKAPLGISLPSPCAALFNEPSEAFLKHLEVHGYAILVGVLGEKAERDRFLKLFWDAMCMVVPNTDPKERETWRFPQGFRGIVTSYGLPQAAFAWQVRLAPKLRGAFARIFGTEDLVVSLDAVIAEPGIPRSRLAPWLHKDQRPEHKELSVQAVYSFYGSGPADAGTCVAPGTHLVTYDWEQGAKRDHVRAPENWSVEAFKPALPPDSAILFNSKLVHASSYGTTMREPDPDTGLPRPSRLGACVAFAPRSRRSEKTKTKKEAAYFQGKCSTHWPCDKFSLKPPHRVFQGVVGAQSLPPPPAVAERLAVL